MIHKENNSYLNIVLKQLKKKKSAIISLWIIFIFFFIAIFAPLLANDKPLILYTNYGEYYKYYYPAWERAHNVYVNNRPKQNELTKQKNKANKEFNLLKNVIHKLNQQKDRLTNKEERLRELINENANNKDLKNQKKKIGAKILSLKQKRVKKYSQKEQLNISLIEIDHKLNKNKNAKLIIYNLDKLKFPLSEKLNKHIDKIKDKYKLIFKDKNINTAIKLGNIKKEIVNTLSFGKVEKELVKKLTFPAFSSLSILDVIFMMGLLFILIFPIVKRIAFKLSHNKITKRRIIYITLIIWITLPCMLLILNSDPQIPINYKNMIIKSSTNDYAIFPMVPFGFNENFLEEKYQKPSILKYISDNNYGRHILGTDHTGRDVLSRMIWGARVSLSVGFVAVSIYVIIGIIIGALAGYFGGWVDIIISRFIEIVICFPSFFLILTIIAFLGPSIMKIMVIIGLTSWTGIARLTRAEFLKLRNQEFVTAAKALGVSNLSIIFKHILPNSLTPVLVSAAFGIASAMLIEAGLSFLGFGVQDPNPSWGQMISMGQSDVLNYWWLSLVPGFAIFISVTTYNLLGDAIREAIDPRLKK